jgi:heme/copper-type cytochrome/quinol oxidase subunit 2
LNIGHFDSISGRIYGLLNSSLNTITNLIMLYLTCARLRKIQYPRTYKQEMLFKYPILISILICIIGVLIWMPVYVFYDLKAIDSLNHDVEAYFSLEILTQLIPLILILIISCFIFYHFKKRNQNTLTTSNNQTYEMNKCLFEVIFNYKINSHTLFAMIMSFYWIQWIIPVSCDLLNDFQAFTEISIDGRHLFLQVDTVCLTEAFLLLMFNPMASILHKPQQNN